MATGSFRLPSGGSTVTAYDWVRPSDWLAMPTIGTQEFIGLLAVTDDESNHIALLCAGAYTVDWGDGVTENVATGIKAQHTYTYSAISSGTLSTRGYKQVLVRVTPQAGQNLTTVSIQQQNSILARFHTVSWLDIAINGSNITTLTLGGSTIVRISMCERVTIGTLGTITNLSSFFNGFHSLQSIPLFNTAAATNMQNMFKECFSLRTVPLFNTIAVTTFQTMFDSCRALQIVPLFNMAAAITLTGMFSSCNSLQTIPLFNTATVTAFSSVFLECNSLQTLPNLNTAAGTSFTSMMQANISLAKGAFQGTRYSISYGGFCLSKSAIVDIFNGLGTAVGTPTVNVSGNPGRAALTAGEILIATAKGWIVV